MHVSVGDEAVLAAIQGTLPQQVSSAGIDAFALIEAGYDVNYSDRDGITPLMAATEKGDTKLVRILLECGAHAMEKDKRGRTALDRVRDPEMQNVFRWHGNVSADSGD
jgi:ankyrin repeat protein